MRGLKFTLILAFCLLITINGALAALDYTDIAGYKIGTGTFNPTDFRDDNINDAQFGEADGESALYYNIVLPFLYAIDFNDTYWIDEIQMYGVGDGTGGVAGFTYDLYVGSNLVADDLYFDGGATQYFNQTFTAVQGDNISMIIESFDTGTKQVFLVEMIPIETTAPATPNSTNATDRYQQLAEIEQNGSTTVTTTTYTTITSDTINISDNSTVYAVGTVNLNPSKDNTAYCRVTIDGVEFNDSERSRSVSAGSNGNLIFTSGSEALAAGSYNVNLECRKDTGNPTFTIDVFNSTVYFHILTSADGQELEYTNIYLTDAIVNTTKKVLGSTTITLSENNTDSNASRYLVVDYAAQIDYSAGSSPTDTVAITPAINGTECIFLERSKESGSRGTVGGACYLDVGKTTNSTAINVSVYGQITVGGGSTQINVTNAYFHIKEFIMNSDEIGNDSYAHTGASWDNLTGQEQYFSVDINTSRHSGANIFSNAFFTGFSLGSTAQGSIYLTNTTKDSATISRTFNPNQYGAMFVQEEFSGTGGDDTINLNSSCVSSCLVGSGSLTAYLVDTVTATPNTFLITANNVYGGALSEFAVNLSDGRSFSTSTGTITIPATDGSVFNVTAQENSGAAIPYFSNYTINFNTTNDLVMNLTPYTVINATYSGVAINNFTVNGTATTNGKVYLRLFNDTFYYINLTQATGVNGTNLSDQTANITASPYLQSYTFALLTANAFNFSIYDELTEALITENMTIEIISSASAGTYYTSNGTLYLDLLTPSDYTIRYYSVSGNYTERDYIQTLTDRERYEIDLYSLLGSEATDMVVTVKDTGGDPVEAAIVKLLRYFTSCNCYKVVEMSTTSAAGEAYFIVDAYDGHYKFAVEYLGETEFLSTSPENFVPTNSLVSRTITINLGSAYFESFRALTDVARTLNYNNATKGLSFTWNDPSGIVTQGCLYAEYLDGVHYTSVTPVCYSGSTGSVVMTLNNSVASYKYYAELETSTTYSDYVVFSGTIDEIVTNLLNGNIGLGAFLGAGIIMVMALMFSFSAIAVVLITGVGIIGMSILGIASLSTVFITGFATLILGLAAYLMRS